MNRLPDDAIRLSGDGIFYTVQGEGPTQGRPAVFCRLHECNLQCDWSPSGGEICDAWYTWKADTHEYQSESRELSTIDLAVRLAQELALHRCRRIVLTGGEPMMQARQLIPLLSQVLQRAPGTRFEVETNGTIMPPIGLLDAARTGLLQINCSPKLASSGMPVGRRRKDEVLAMFAVLGACFKFVVADERDEDEIAGIVYDVGIDAAQVWLMPEGTSDESLHRHASICADIAKRKGYNVSGRLQFMMFGADRYEGTRT